MVGSAIDFLNNNNGTITVFITFALAGITFWYVLVTKQILKASNNPQVILFLHHNRGKISLCVQNIGTGYASDIKFTGDLSFKPTLPLSIDKALKELPPFKDGINYLGAGQKIYTLLCSVHHSNKLEKKTIDIVVFYKDSTNAKMKPKSYSFELGNWDNTNQFISPQNDDIENHLDRISSTLEEMRNLDFSGDKWPQSSFPEDNSQIVVLERIAEALDRMSSDE